MTPSSGSTVGLICVYHSGADVNLETDLLFSVGNEILADGVDFSKFSNALILSTNFSDYKPIDVNIDCTEENGTCSMNAIVDYRLSDHLTAFEVEVYYTSKTNTYTSVKLNSLNCTQTSGGTSDYNCSVTISDVILTTLNEFIGVVNIYNNVIFGFTIQEDTIHFEGPSPPVITVFNGVFVRTNIQSLNETSVQFITSVDNNDWQAQLYHIRTSCKDVNGNSLPNNECEITTPNTWTPEPVDLVLSSLIPGKEYTISLDQISFRNGNDPITEASTFPASATFCS
ncbi:uncharacterized protein LOC142357773, partial [Convolutriloba macropyga]|uniref:uncharacterized protein LOC142357773 n=1 Tax=Convolutriloba macropyga TaxID=536237 RepID=UPI003F51C2D7